jgi:tetratricopeptide (TPR) repeat protein
VALEYFEIALMIKPDDPTIYANMAQTLFALKDYEKAIESLKKVVELDPKNSKVYANIGHILYRQGKYDEAMVNIKKAIELDPDNAMAYGNMANVLCAQGHYDKAIESYLKCLTLNPEFFGAKANIAEVYLVTGRYENAFNRANEVLEEKNLAKSDKIAMKFILCASLVLHGKDTEVPEALQRLIKYYRSIPVEYEDKWNYENIKISINQNKTLKNDKKYLLLQLIEIIESPRNEGDKKLKELETWLKGKSLSLVINRVKRKERRKKSDEKNSCIIEIFHVFW